MSSTMGPTGRRALVALALATIAVSVAIIVRLARSRSQGMAAIGDVVPSDPVRMDELVDTASEESFPASDPPSYWGRSDPGVLP